MGSRNARTNESSRITETAKLLGEIILFHTGAYKISQCSGVFSILPGYKPLTFVHVIKITAHSLRRRIWHGTACSLLRCQFYRKPRNLHQGDKHQRGDPPNTPLPLFTNSGQYRQPSLLGVYWNSKQYNWGT